MTVYLLRHGETDWNIAGRLQGARSDIPLNANGVDVAQKTAEGMRREGIRFQKVYSSPLSRAITTARIISGATDIICDQRLVEYNFGPMEGQHFPNLEQAVPIASKSGGETIALLRNRVDAFFTQLIDDHANSDEHILISTHGMALRAFLANIKALPSVFDTTAHDNCGMTILRIENNETSIIAENKRYY